MSLSRVKRKVEELGEQVVSAAIGDVVGRTVSAAVCRYDAHATVDEQLERLELLVIHVHATVEQAEGVHIRSWWLRRWLWRLRDAALDADEVLTLFRQRRARAAQEASAAAAAGLGGNSVWNAAKRAFWTAAKSLLPFRSVGDDENDDMDRLSRTVARMEMVCSGVSDFATLLRLEIRMSMRPNRSELSPRFQSLVVEDDEDGITTLAGADFDHEVFYISRGEYVSAVVKIGLLILKRNILRAIIGNNQRVVVPRRASRLRMMQLEKSRVSGVQMGGGAAANKSRRGEWLLAEWRRELLAVADRADRAGCAARLAFFD